MMIKPPRHSLLRSASSIAAGLAGRIPTAAWTTMALACLAPTAALSEQRPHYFEFQPSPSETAIGYVIHLGTRSGVYPYHVDIGRPSQSGGTLVYEATFEVTSDLYFAMSSYDAEGNPSAFSNEVHVPPVSSAPPDPAPAPTPPPDPVPASEPVPQEMPYPDSIGQVVGSARTRVGIMADLSGMIYSIQSDGSLPALTLDSLASARDLRPTRCDLDGDSDSDLVIGFGPGSDGQVALLYLENDAVTTAASITVGDARYHGLDGQTRPACGDVDGDGLPELVVGLGADGNRELTVFDDHETGFARFDIGANGVITAPSNSRMRRDGTGTAPALGDIDGDGRDELIIGYTLGQTRRIAVLDDATAGFARHPNVEVQNGMIRVGSALKSNRDGGGTYPSAGDWDGDGLDEIVIGYGAGGGSWISFLDDARAQVYDRYPGFLAIQVGRRETWDADGSTYPVMGNIDGDEADEILVGFGGAAGREIQVFDDQRGGKLGVYRGGMGFVTSADPDARWFAAPAR